MNETKDDLLAEQFEQCRQHLLSVAYRMLGSLSDAEDAVQESWLRLSRTDMSDVQNTGGWLRTVVSRICLDTLRARGTRREDSLESLEAEGLALAAPRHRVNAAQEAEMADSVGLALLVVLDRLNPVERVAFVLHDMFDVPFDDIAPIVGRSSDTARQIASRARRRVTVGDGMPNADSLRKREVIDAYLAAARRGDFEALIALLDPDIEFEADAAAVLAGASPARGATIIANSALRFRAFSARVIYINGQPGIAVAPRGHLKLLLLPAVENGRITSGQIIGDKETIARFELTVAADTATQIR